MKHWVLRLFAQLCIAGAAAAFFGPLVGLGCWLMLIGMTLGAQARQARAEADRAKGIISP